MEVTKITEGEKSRKNNEEDPGEISPQRKGRGNNTLERGLHIDEGKGN